MSSGSRPRLTPSTRHGFLPLCRIPLPPGAHARLGPAVRAARVKDALGPVLAGQLATVESGPDGVTLVFGGSGWERALAQDLPLVADRVRAALGRPGAAVAVRSDPDAPPPRSGKRRAAPSAGGPRAATAGRSPVEPGEGRGSSRVDRASRGR